VAPGEEGGHEVVDDDVLPDDAAANLLDERAPSGG
jgi:hypothetical protein